MLSRLQGKLALWEVAENQWVNRFTIKPQTFGDLKEIKLKAMKIQR